VLLDAGGTLFTEVEARDAVYARVLAGYGARVALPEMARLRAELHDAMPEVFAGAARYTDPWFREFVRRLLLHLVLPADAEEVRLRLAEHFQRAEHFVVFPDTLPALEELAARGVRLGVVSNWSDRLGGLLEELQLSRYFEVVVASALVGACKPHPTIFQHALERFHAPPERVVHVGDHPVNDLLGARRSGLAALLLDRSGEHSRDPAAIRTLEDLPRRLG